MNFIRVLYSSGVQPNALILAWYNSLAVKTSNALTTALNTLSQGLFDDGDWAKLDLFGLVGGMETQEQRLRPLVTTSGDDFVINGAPVLNANGFNPNASGGYLDLKWNPTTDGVQYTLNSAFISSYCHNDDIAYSNVMLGSADSLGAQSAYPLRNGTVLSGIINNDGSALVPTIDNGVTSYYTAVVLNGGNITLHKNAVTNAAAFASPQLPIYDFYGGELNIEDVAGGFGGIMTLRHFMAGAGTANQTQIQARLNTFYASRGL